ncbi:FAD binding domain-containing protein [Trichophyton equinum CBS 127.97]|uniref:FAD binding domain-containing protein n=1 Tax=Trichophyton equinum (strain ATCC MYA-4606 / CBS 127.97) TaxID=559882 RepID=F2PT22_TRIEC|nr:FAD binding domain-containing protein [Trichophyton equinum CBS 127.97]
MRSSVLLASAVYGSLSAMTTALSTPECCSALAKDLPKNVFTSDSKAWDTHNKDFWCRCVFLPETSEHVSKAVQILAENDCKFSIKGAGHSAIPGAANIHDGVMIAMAWMNSTDIQDDYIRVGAGAHLGEVYKALDPHNKAAVVGRFSEVGLGMVVGAGISFFSNSEGLAIDNVVNFEVVIASGEVINANATSNPDQLWALKGGNNNFGVVTQYSLATINTAGMLHGGVITYPESSFDEYAYDGATNETTAGILVAYNDAVDELPEIMQPWLKVNYTTNTLGKKTYGELAEELNGRFAGDGFVQEQRVFTVYADAQFYKDVWFKFRQWFQDYRDIPGFQGSHGNMPITPRQVEEGVKKGGNALGLQEGPQDKTLGIIYFGVTFQDPKDADKVLPAHKEFVESMRKLAEDRGVLHPYIMLTFSGYDQPAIASYGEKNVAKLHEVSAMYDPKGVFQRLVPGGQKLPARK